MEEKVLDILEPDVLNKSFNNCGVDEPFKKYLLEEVFPYMDLSCETVNLKSGLVVSLKDFLEQSVLYTCQNRYGGNFVDFAKDNIISFEEGKKKVSNKGKKSGKRFSNINEDFKFSPIAKTYTFFETIDGPKYNVVVDRGKIYFYYKDENFDVIMQNENDKKDFLKRIKKMDLSYFIKLYENNPLFKDLVTSYKDDTEYYEALLSGVVRRSPFDREIDKQIGEITDMISEVESDPIYATAEANYKKESTQGFDINALPRFDTDTCLKTVLSKCTAYYSEFSNDVDASLADYSVNENAEFIIDEYLFKVIDNLFMEYVKGVESSVNNDSELDINEVFLSSEMGTIMSNLRAGLKKIFVYPYRDKELDSSDTYIKIISDAIENQILFYEQLVNSTIEGMLVNLGYVLRENDDELTATIEIKPQQRA